MPAHHTCPALLIAANWLNELVERQIKAITEGTTDDDDGAAGLLVPTG
ncbi:hypothetical protein Kfla_2281 [Kribbella flavida DSM 17836]|uniref:Uncharacterized protein n=1 Tax=Kribbella flavida (strain DSM 17836 / JCM 10339 / NBRC 14399) TaxID=479435 RepID=D2PTP4_KRIFD|nr:hypothetical protein Kfla_2281 [Kribbella flavida DSM 17836]